MDEAWKIERGFWSDASIGNAGRFYALHMTADGYVVLPSGVVERNDLIVRWDAQVPLRAYSLSEPRLTLIDGGSVLVHYHVIADGPALPDYRAWITSLYTWEGDTWVLAFRQHTPVAAFAF